MEEYEKRQIIEVQTEEDLQPQKTAIEIIYIVMMSVLLILTVMILYLTIKYTDDYLSDLLDHLLLVIFIIAYLTVITNFTIAEYCFIIVLIVKIKRLQIQNSKKINGKLIPLVIVGIVTAVGTQSFFYHIFLNLPRVNLVSYYAFYITLLGTFIITGGAFFIISRISEEAGKEQNKKYLPIRITPVINGVVLLVAFGIYLGVRVYKALLGIAVEDVYFIIISAIIHSVTSVVCQAILLTRKAKIKKRMKEQKELMIEKQGLI
ncbi:MAG: hypothetical protein ACFFDW_06500 [Candidatus Thorarchaeota archaeon]